MSPLFTFILGLLIGWLIEWVIDYFYWRRRYPEKEAAGRMRPIENMGSRSAVKAAPDDLKIIKGIGPVIERKLNDAGIFTYDQLGSLSTAGLRRILGNSIERLADEESLLQQARDLARRK
jgi:predicted flap endonuclease-1-like 5' DNA nuclease